MIRYCSLPFTMCAGFTYNKEHHNVIQVTRDDYHSCNTSSPLATFASGNDHIPIIWKGHYFYISAGKNDCARGQKVNVRVVVEGERGNIYQVGDGEALFGSSNVSYSAWVSSKNFKVGDILVFRYNNEAQSVIQVSKEDYHKCNTSSPRATFNSGNDHIPIMHYGHYFYTSSNATRCAAGQKVDIRVPYPPALMLGHEPLPVSLVSAPAPAPARSGTYKKGLSLAVALGAIAAAI
ncbi:uncharacterized protein A4U43_C08F10180 [Asparagus officinalis]|nr:uncharacterized protein A4U43_C08F10180 [Asparagus officinalis]